MEHRTQIYLAEKHYRFLREMAERESVSLAQAIRSLIEKEMPTDELWETDPVWTLHRLDFRSGLKTGSHKHHEHFRASLKKHHRGNK